MNKTTAKALAEKYEMKVLRNPVTSEAWAVSVESDELIPELDAYADAPADNVRGDNTAIVERTYAGTYTYKIICPTRWFDLWGWR
jgi:hypothetical protein